MIRIIRRATLLRRIACALPLALALAAPAQAADKVTFLLDWLPAGDKAVPYYALEKGLFAAQNLDVTIQSGRGSSDVVTKLATGAADMGTGGLAALLQAKAESDVGVTAVMSVYTMQPDAIFTTEGSGIATLKDLVGKQIGTAPFSSSNVAWPIVESANGIDPEKVSVLKIDPGALAPMLASGKVAATINWITVEPAFVATLKEAGKTLKVIPWSDYGFDGYGLSVFASDRMLKERPDVVKRTLAAMVKAQDALLADPAAAGAAVKAKVPEIDADVATAQWKASIPLIANPIAKKDGMGMFEPKLLATTWHWVAKAQNIPESKIDPAKLVDTHFLP